MRAEVTIIVCPAYHMEKVCVSSLLRVRAYY